MKKMYLLKVEGTYATHTDGVKEFTSFNFEKTIPFIPDTWILSMVQSRFVPMWIKTEKNKANGRPLYPKQFDQLISCRISDYEIVNEDDNLSGLDLTKIDDEYILQEIACKYLLIQAPLPYKVGIKELRERVIEEYLKVVVGIKADTEQEKNQYEFYKKNNFGEWVLDFSGQSFIIKEIEHKEDSFDALVQKKTLTDVLVGHKADISEDVLFDGL